MTEHAAAKIPRRRIDGAWYGFLTVGFLVIGLAGIFGTYASQVPYQRGELAEQVLDRAAATHTAAELAGLKSELGDNAAIMARQNVPLAENITAARAATRAIAGRGRTTRRRRRWMRTRWRRRRMPRRLCMRGDHRDHAAAQQ